MYAYEEDFRDKLWYLPCAALGAAEQEDHMKNVKKQKIRSRWLSATMLAVGATGMLSSMASQINVYNVTDSAHTVQVKTFTQDPQAVVRIAGFDSDAYALIADTGEDGLVRTLTVEKKFPVNVVADGQTRTLDTVTTTVGALLQEYGITLNPLDEVTPAVDSAITADGAREIKIVRVTQETETTRVKVPFTTTKRNTSELQFGQTRIKQAGIDGVSEQVVRVTKRDGVESAREVQSETVISAPQQEILEYGTGGAVVTRGGQALRYSRVINVKATAYSTEGWSHENKFTKIGTRCRVGAIAVDPSVIPLGSRLYITSADGKSWVYGTAVAEDTGSAIKGNRIDLYYNTQDECEAFGVRSAKVYVLS